MISTLPLQHEIVLSALPERHAIHGERSAEHLGSIDVFAQRNHRQMPLDMRTAFGGMDPIRHELPMRTIVLPPYDPSPPE